MSDPFSIKRTATLPRITGEFTDKDGNPVDLTGATVNFYMKNVDTGVLQVNGGTADIDDAANGQVSYHFTAGDTAIVGRYYCEWLVTDSPNTEILPTRSFGIAYVEENLIPIVDSF